jgi:RHS repeat-associated protein
MPGRKFSSGSGYRYGFNGQERSTEINNNSYTAEFWQYDARLGRRWNIDPILKVGESPYSTFSNNPIWFSDYNGADTTLPMAASGSVTLPDQARGGIETYSGAPTYIHGTTTPVPVQQGQLRSFSVPEIGKFSARWEADENGEAVFLGYLNDAGKDFNSAVGEYNAKIDLDNTCKRLNHFFEDPFNQALLILGPVQMQMSMMESGNPSAGNPSVVTSEAFAEIELTTAAEIESGAVLASESTFS